MQINNTQLNQDTYLNLNQSLNRIGTGQQLNSAANDASSLAIAQNLQVQSSGISQSVDNISSSFATIQIADQAVGKQSEILDQVKEKLLQASTDTTSQDGRKALLNDIQGLLENFNDISSSTNYNGQTLLQASSEDSSATSGLEFQTGVESSDSISLAAIQSNTSGVGLNGLLNQDSESFTSEQARAYLESVDSALTSVNDYRSELGSTQNQLQSSSQNMISQLTQTNNATSILQDVDYANEVSNFSKQNILAQIGAYGAAQSNNINQSIVSRLLS